MTDKYFSIRNSRTVDQTAEPAWIVCLDGQPVGPSDDVPADLLKIKSMLGEPAKDDQLFASVVDVDDTLLAQDQCCPRLINGFDQFVPLPRRGQFEMAIEYRHSGWKATRYGHWFSQQASPSLAAALHRFYGTEAATEPKRPVPPPAPEPTPAERKAALVYRAATSVFNTTAPNHAELIRAGSLLNTFAEYMQLSKDSK